MKSFLHESNQVIHLVYRFYGSLQKRSSFKSMQEDIFCAILIRLSKSRYKCKYHKRVPDLIKEFTFQTPIFLLAHLQVNVESHRYKSHLLHPITIFSSQNDCFITLFDELMQEEEY